MVTVLIRYQIDPLLTAEFGEYADRWTGIMAESKRLILREERTFLTRR
jgi:hypothetical protein